DRIRDQPVFGHPIAARQIRLKQEEQQSWNPRDHREQDQQHRDLAGNVFEARKRAAQIERQGVVCQVARDQNRPDDHCENKRECRLNVDEEEKECAADRKTLCDLERVRAQSRERRHVVTQVDEDRIDQWADVTQHEERGEEFVFEKVLISVTRQHQKPRPRRGQFAFARFISVFVNGHCNSPEVVGGWWLVPCPTTSHRPPTTSYCVNSEVKVAPFICGRTARIFTTLRLSFATQTVVLPGSPSAEVTSSLNVSKSPAGTVTFSAPATFTCFKATFCFCRSRFRKVAV